MHDTHVHGSCGECASFVGVFPPSTRYDEWGYCREQRNPPPPRDLAPLVEAFLSGDRAPLRRNPLGVYRTEPDDACEFFRHKEL